jgi:glycerol-3-phosphate O-acyltransferase
MPLRKGRNANPPGRTALSSSVTLPFWLLGVLVALAAWTAAERFVAPGVRWYLRRQTRRVLDDVGARLRIQLPPFKLTRRQVLVDRLVHDPLVLRAADDATRAGGEAAHEVRARVEAYAREIVPGFNAYLYFRVGYWLARRVAHLLYRVRLGYSDEVGLAGIRPGATVVFVMNHRSNMDYILVGYLAAGRAALSYAVGEWARIWPLQSLIRAMGAYFIRRGSGDALYRRVLERYVAMATAEGVTQAVFLEGGLTRNGRLGAPRLGILDYMIRGFDPGGHRDLVFIPVGVNYDRTLEDRSLLLAGEGRGTESRARAVAIALGFIARNVGLAVRNRWFRFGYACVNFGRPVSARDYLAARGVDPRTLPTAERFAEVERLAATLMAEVGAVVPVLPTPVMATVFLSDPGAALDELELKARAYALLRELDRAGARIYVPREDQDYALAVGLRMLVLRRAVELVDGLYRARVRELPLLRYYANSIAHHLEREAVPA